MQTSNNGKLKITEWEGFKSKVYKDAAGLPTIGVGHLLTRSELTSGKIIIKGETVRYAAGLTKDQVEDLLGQDLQGKEEAVNDGVKVKLNQNQFDALVSFCFNVGSAAFKDSTLLRLLNQGDYGSVPAQLRRWVHCGGEVVDGLVNRRKHEIELWNA